MAEPAQSLNWPLIAKLRPQLHQHVNIFAQQYRGEHWYLLCNRLNARHHRFGASAYAFIGRLDGHSSVEEIWHKTVDTPGVDALGQEDIGIILTQLFELNLLKIGPTNDAEGLFKQLQHERRLRWRGALANPLALRFSLLDPDSILNRFMPWMQPLFSRAGFILWFFIVSVAALLTLTYFSDISAAVDKDMLSPGNLISMLTIFVIIKTVHEFAHAFAVKRWGGEVHDMGIALLVLAPVPYMDASAAWQFRDKHKRVLVGAAGILAELLLAALALFVWLLVEPGWVQDAALNAFLIASASTLLFNANPLLRFDGYYILQDWIEIPNLYSRSGRYYRYLALRYLFSHAQAQSPTTAAGEPVWFAFYGFAAFFYRLFILAVIVLFLAEKFLFLGVALGLWAVIRQVIIPSFQGLHFLSVSPILRGCRFRAVAASTLVISAISAALVFVPVPMTTRAEGIVWVSDQAQVYTGVTGFVNQVLIEAGTEVETGTTLAKMQSAPLDMQILKREARRRELAIRTASERFEKRVQSAITNQELKTIDSELISLKEQQAALSIRSQVQGTFVLADALRIEGRFLRQGEILGYVFSPQHLIIRVAIPQSDIGLIRQQVNKIEVRLAERLDETLKAHIVRETPAASAVLPGRALGVAGGVRIAVKMSDDGLTPIENVFHLDLKLADEADITGVGERVYVRFDHGAKPLASQWLHVGRQLLLSRLSF